MELKNWNCLPQAVNAGRKIVNMRQDAIGSLIYQSITQIKKRVLNFFYGWEPSTLMQLLPEVFNVNSLYLIFLYSLYFI